MPTVPRADQSLIGSAPRPAVRLPTDIPAAAFGVPEGYDLSGVERHVREIAQDARQKADQIAFMDADSQASALETKVLVDPQTGALNLRGKNAFNAMQVAGDAWQKGVAEIEQSLTTDQQRMAFRRAMVARSASIHDQVQRHVATQITAYDQDTTKSYVANEQNAAITSYQNPERVQLATARVTAAYKDFGRRNGLPDDEVQALTQDAVTKVHAGVISRFLSNDQDLAAKAYYDKVKDQIAGSDAPQIEKALDEGSARGESQRQADAILAKAQSLSDAISAVRQIKDPKVRDLTEQRVRQDFAERENALREQRERIVGVATNIVEQTHDFTRIPAPLVATMPVADRRSLREYAQLLQKGTPPVTNWSTYYGLMSLGSSAATRDDFLKTNLIQYRPQLADAEFKQLTDLQASLRKGDAAAEDRVEAAHQIDATIKRSLEAVNVNPNAKPGTDDATRIDAFYRQFKTAKSALEARTQKPASEEEVRGIIDNLLIRHVTEHSWWWNTQGPLGFEMQPGDEEALTATDVPALERRKIVDALHTRGLAATDARVLELYRAKLRRMKGGGR